MGRLKVMEVLMTVLVLAVLVLCASRWAVDSRLPDTDRATRWWPATPRD